MIRQSRKGFTVLELMVAVAIVGVFTAMAAPQFGDWRQKQRVKNASRSLARAFTLARAEAISQDRNHLSRDVYQRIAQHDAGFFYKATEGEKFVTDVTIFAGKVIVASYTPVSGADLCTTSGGQAFLHVIDVGDGEGYFPLDPDNPDPVQDRRLLIGGGLPSSPRVSIAPDPADDRIYIKTSTGQIA